MSQTISSLEKLTSHKDKDARAVNRLALDEQCQKRQPLNNTQYQSLKQINNTTNGNSFAVTIKRFAFDGNREATAAEGRGERRRHFAETQSLQKYPPFFDNC